MSIDFTNRRCFHSIGSLALTVIIFGSTVFAQQPTTSPLPSPTAMPVPTPQVKGVGSNTVLDLQTKIRQRLADPALRRGSVGIKIASLNSGTILFEENSERYFMPASNMKNFTVATALEKLTPEFRYITRVLADSKPDADGTLKGDIYVRGSGDVSISYTFNDGDNFKGIDRLVDALIAAGVKRVDGNIVGDDSFFRGSPTPNGWEWDDLQWYYGAEVSALSLNDNVVSLRVTPGPLGYQCAAKILPFNFIYRVQNTCTTGAAGTPRTLRIEKKLNENMIEISGNLPVGDTGFSNTITVSRPAALFASMLKQRLMEKGVPVTAQTRAISSRAAPAQLPTPLVEVAKIESPPLALIAAKTMKPSQNMYTETLLWTLGEDARAKNMTTPVVEKSSAELGAGVVKSFLGEIGIAEDAVQQYDGSGLSRHNLVTPSSVVQLYTYMGTRSRFSKAWRDSLTIGGVDGTLRNRFQATRAEANVRGKTGTINQVSALSGYVTTAAGEQLVFSVLVNGVPESRKRVGLIDEIVLMLANFTGKVER